MPYQCLKVGPKEEILFDLPASRLCRLLIVLEVSSSFPGVHTSPCMLPDNSVTLHQVSFVSFPILRHCISVE